jgi:hypothetical protein
LVLVKPTRSVDAVPVVHGIQGIKKWIIMSRGFGDFSQLLVKIEFVKSPYRPWTKSPAWKKERNLEVLSFS